MMELKGKFAAGFDVYYLFIIILTKAEEALNGEVGGRMGVGKGECVDVEYAIT